MGKLKAITPSMLKVFNVNRPPVLRCKVMGHKFGPVAKPLPMRISGKIRQYEIEGCIRCGFTKVLNPV